MRRSFSSGRRRRTSQPLPPPGRSNGEPIVVGGLTYYPTRGFRLFDGQVMAQTGMFEGVPVYSDTTIEPYSELYVPLGSGRMRVYERRRERELAGTTGSHVPTFPVDSPSVPAPRERTRVTADDATERRRRHRRIDRAARRRPTPTRCCRARRAAAAHRDHAGRAAARPTASGSSSTARAGTATVPRSRSRPIASSRWASIAASRCIATRPAAATTSGCRS